MWIHRVSGFLIFAITITFASILINLTGASTRPDNPHAIIGIIILALVIAITLFGVFTRSRMNRLRWKTVLILRVKNMHKVTFIVFN
jgi:hypothetical protein